MAYVGMTGQGAIATLSTTGAVGCIRSIKLPEWTQEKIDASCLDTTDWMRYIPGDLKDPGQVEMTAVFDPSLAMPEPSVQETLTVTFPIGDPANATNAVLTGSGFVSSVGLPSMEINNLLELTLTFCFDGDDTDPPTFSPEAA